MYVISLTCIRLHVIGKEKNTEKLAKINTKRLWLYISVLFPFSHANNIFLHKRLTKIVLSFRIKMLVPIISD